MTSTGSVRVRGTCLGLALAIFVMAGPSESVAKKKEPAAPAAKATPGPAVNVCGCYRDAKGGCVCTDKKGKCDCPGDCEPVGCGEKRDKEMEREMQIEIKRAQEDDKKRQAAEEAQENGTVAAPDAGETPPPPPAKPAKAPRKK